MAAHADRQPSDGLPWGVEPICAVPTRHGVKIAPNTYCAARSRAPSARSVADAALLPEIVRVHSDRTIGRGPYRARKVWHTLRRECPRTPSGATSPPPARTSCGSWTSPTWRPGRGWRSPVRLPRVSRRIVGRTAPAMPTELPLDALEMALWTRTRLSWVSTGSTRTGSTARSGTFHRSSRDGVPPSEQPPRATAAGKAPPPLNPGASLPPSEQKWDSAKPKMWAQAGGRGSRRART